MNPIETGEFEAAARQTPSGPVGKDISSPGNAPRNWFRVFRPLLWWALLVLCLYAHRTHQRLMQETRLRFDVNTIGRSWATGPQATLDGVPVWSGQQVSLGSHRFEINHPKA